MLINEAASLMCLAEKKGQDEGEREGTGGRRCVSAVLWTVSLAAIDRSCQNARGALRATSRRWHGANRGSRVHRAEEGYGHVVVVGFLAGR
jgi:hypothetical protein